MEIVIEDINNKEDAEKKIKNLADELEIKLMTNEEIKVFTESVESKL